MEWVRLDPGSELIALIRLRQPEAVLAAQLERSKDVLAQSAAITGLAATRPVTYGVVNALRACMQNSSFYCRWFRWTCPARSGLPCALAYQSALPLLTRPCSTTMLTAAWCRDSPANLSAAHN